MQKNQVCTRKRNEVINMDDDKKDQIKSFIEFVLFVVIVFALGCWLTSIFLDHFGYIIVGGIICGILLVGDLFSHFL